MTAPSTVNSSQKIFFSICKTTYHVADRGIARNRET